MIALSLRRGYFVVQQSLFDDRDTGAAEAAALPARRVHVPGASERAAWEAWKARLLPGFITPYCHALAASRLHRSCWWVDGLATASQSLPTQANSLPFAAAAEALAASGFTLRGARLEPDRPRSKKPETSAESQPASMPDKQQAALQSSGRKAREKILPASSAALASVARGKLLETLGTAPVILLLNPFAALPLTAEELLPLCQRQAPTELLLPISAARLTQLAEQAIAGQAAPLALTALLRSDAWKAIWTGPDKSAEKVQRTLELLRGLLKPHFLHVCLATLDEAPLPTPRRFLLVASRQYASVALLNDFLCTEQARLASEREARALQGSWFARRREAARAAAWAALKEELHTLGRLRRARLWPDLKPLLVLEHFGQFSSADYDAALLELLREGRVFCRWSPNGPSADAAAAPGAPLETRVPGAQDFLEFIEAKARPVWRR
jgi:hypothetical protein